MELARLAAEALRAEGARVLKIWWGHAKKSVSLRVELTNSLPPPKEVGS